MQGEEDGSFIMGMLIKRHYMCALKLFSFEKCSRKIWTFLENVGGVVACIILSIKAIFEIVFNILS